MFIIKCVGIVIRICYRYKHNSITAPLSQSSNLSNKDLSVQSGSLSDILLMLTSNLGSQWSFRHPSSESSGCFSFQQFPAVFCNPRQTVSHQCLLQTPPGLVYFQLLLPVMTNRHTEINTHLL